LLSRTLADIARRAERILALMIRTQCMPCPSAAPVYGTLFMKPSPSYSLDCAAVGERTTEHPSWAALLLQGCQAGRPVMQWAWASSRGCEGCSLSCVGENSFCRASSRAPEDGDSFDDQAPDPTTTLIPGSNAAHRYLPLPHSGCPTIPKVTCRVCGTNPSSLERKRARPRQIAGAEIDGDRGLCDA